jgi:broad specificity phosphatase PhoE
MATHHVPWNIRDEYYDKPLFGMEARIRHRLLLVRHGESDANHHLTTTGGDIDAVTFGEPQLTNVGHQQAQCVAHRFAHWPAGAITRVECSPMSRALQTAMPFLNQLDKSVPVWVDTNLMEIWRARPGRLPYFWQLDPTTIKNLIQKQDRVVHFVDARGHEALDDKFAHKRRPESVKDAKQRIARLVRRWKSLGSVDQREQTIVFAHSLLISGILDHFTCGHATSGASFNLANGSVTCLDIDEMDEIRVHFVNCTAHIDAVLRTGHHTPI